MIKKAKLFPGSCKFYQREDSVLLLEIQRLKALGSDTPEREEVSESEVGE